MRDDPSPLSRISRYGKVSLGATTLFPNLLLKSLGFSINDHEHAENIRRVLGNLKGPLMKIAQILGAVPEILPEHYAEELRTLQASAPSMGWPFVKRRMTHELGPSWPALFKDFESQASFAASLGQVHRARDNKGRVLALKLQYPGMENIIEADLAQFKLLLSLYRKLSPAFETEEIFQEIKLHLLAELDYKKEAQNMEIFRTLLRPFKEIHIPLTIPELTTKRLLALSWEEGEPLLNFKNTTQNLRNTLGQNLFNAWYFPFYHGGMLHGDPHPGNYRGLQDGRIILFDFGCVRVFNPHFIKGVIDLYRALLTHDEALMVFAYESWGFKNLQKDVLKILNLWAHFLYGPLLYDRSLRLQEISTPSSGKNLAAQIYKELKKTGGISPPREFVFMDRVAVGLGSLFIHLDIELNWHQLFEKLIENFEITSVKKRQKELLEPFV